jgi:hypothetical protein
MPHYTQDEWMRLVADNFPSALPPEMEAFRNANNVFVDGLPPPKYSGPLSTGGYAGTPPQTQGPSTVDPEDDTPDQDQTGALPGPVTSVPEWSKAMSNLTKEETDYGAKYPADRTKHYEETRDAILKRRLGPTQSEQLFALAAAIGTPMLRPSLGGVMHNVGMTMADFQKANREAEQQRADALLALNQTYANDLDAAQRAQFKARREALAAQGTVLARASAPHTTINPKTGLFVDRNNPRPTENVYYDPKTRFKVVQWQDGYWRQTNPDGSTTTYERYGDEFRPVVEGAGK